MTQDTGRKKTMLFISASMMELTWLYALSCTIFFIFDFSVLPIWSAVLSFFVPVLITFTLQGRGKRVIVYFLVHSIFYLIILLYTFYSYGIWQSQGSFLKFQWLEMLLSGNYGSIDGFSYILILFFISLFWSNGTKLTNRSHDHLLIATRFDFGIMILVFVFILSGIMNFFLPYSNLLIIYYFLFSMLAISLAKNLESSTSATNNSWQLNKTNLVFPFILLILILGSWMMLFFLPQMTTIAQAGNSLLKLASRPLGSLLLRIISFLFGLNRNTASTEIPSPPEEKPIAMVEETELAWWVQVLSRIIGGLFLILIIFVLLIFIGILLWALWKWLSAKTGLDSNKKGFFQELSFWINYFFVLSKKLLAKIKKKFMRKEENILIIFQKLCRWGHLNGLSKKDSRTPLEYGQLLATFFPQNHNDIGIIIDSFNKKIYGAQTISSQQMEKVKRAWKRLSSPLKWPQRIKVKLFYSWRKKDSESVANSIDSEFFMP